MAIADKLNYLSETKSQIKEAIKGKGVEVSDEDTFRSYVSKISEIQVGESSADAFWGLRTNDGTNGKGIFAYAPAEVFNKDDFVEKFQNLDMKDITSLEYAFANSQASELDFSNKDLSKCKNLNYAFAQCSMLKTVDFTNCNLKPTQATMSFSQTGSSRPLVSIKGIIDVENIKNTNLTILNNNASSAPNNLEEIYLKNFTAPNINLSLFPKLIRECLIFLLQNALETTTTRIINMGPENRAKLTAEEIAIGTNKGYTIS